jgi:hypothetical protein
METVEDSGRRVSSYRAREGTLGRSGLGEERVVNILTSKHKHH